MKFRRRSNGTEPPAHSLPTRLSRVASATRPVAFGDSLALLVALASLFFAACDSSTETTPHDAESADAANSVERSGSALSVQADDVPRNPLKDAFFGDLHIHSSWSLDAFALGVRVGPEDAYRYARGGAIDHVSGEKIQMQGPPLDFMALTEHANYMGVSTAAQDPQSPFSKLPLIQSLISTDVAVNGAAMAKVLGHLGSDTLIPGFSRETVVDSTWSRIVELADQNNRPGEFTAFVAYEYTSMPEGQNLHRNVIFEGSDVPVRPFSRFDSPNPEDLWIWMEMARAAGSDVIAIPHNANGSNGLMYQAVDRSGQPIDAPYAEIRLRNEPVSEIIQIKGQSETHPGLSPNDEWARFEILDTILGRPGDKSQLEGSYARRALMLGLEMEEADGFNPYRFGMIGASDGHNASSPVEEDNYTGKIGAIDGTPNARIQPYTEVAAATPDASTGKQGVLPGEYKGPPPDRTADMDLGDRSSGSPFSAAGLAGVWAEANTRQDLFDALRAREVFATSGPRIRIRFFGGWDLRSEDLESGIARAGYARGVPMGGALGLASARDERPAFLIQALRDPREAPLERMQIVKAWVEDGKAREKVFEVACADGSAPDPADHRCRMKSTSPDLSDCSFDASTGRSELTASWADPEFDLGQRAFYYARVLQIPTCRWSSFDAIRLGVEPLPGAVAWLQERAVTSPIWYAPGGPGGDAVSGE